MNYNFIRTQDSKVSDMLLKLGFKLVDNKDGFFTFVNDKSLKFSDDFDATKLHYTNILCL